MGVLRMWGNEKTETNIRSIEGELDNEENTSPEGPKGSPTGQHLNTRAAMSPWKVHLESFKNVKDEAAAARQVANELQAELDSTKKDLEQITGRLDTVEVSRRLLDDKVRS